MTEKLVVDPVAPDPRAIAAAAETLRRGGLVAFPTETVYGLGALALDEAAAGRIFAAKGRPPTNPLIVHAADVAAGRSLAAPFTPLAEALAKHFWPGPLTIVVKRAPHVPAIVTAGGDTVALRVPEHGVAHALLAEVDRPIAAPSANASNGVSPTRAEHVLATLDGRIDLVLDGGPTELGLESTVVDATGKRAVVLRPGSITVADLEAAGFPVAERDGATGVARSPGQLAKHYAPRNRVLVLTTKQLVSRAGEDVTLVAFSERVRGGIRMPRDPDAYAAKLYAALHDADRRGKPILVEKPPQGDRWVAVHDRLRRAAQ